MNKPNNLEPLWMPFTPNKTFKKDPRIIVGAKDMHFISDDNREILDGTAGLWCVNAGHGRKKIQEAVNEQIENTTPLANNQVQISVKVDIYKSRRTIATYINMVEKIA